jgi:hypothetical protein
MKATRAAISALMPVKRFEKRTLYGDIEHRFQSVRLTMKASPPGMFLFSFPFFAFFFLENLCVYWTCELIEIYLFRIWRSRQQPHP